ncbi:MAG: threonine synthase [Spirochaetota bacterium]
MDLVQKDTNFRAHFRCFNPDYPETYELDQIVYRCESCDDLLEVVHDTDALKKYSPEEWKQCFDARLGSIEFPNTSGVWNKREWVLPQISLENIVSMGEGRTHLLDAGGFAKELGLESLHIKQCGVSHTGSFKDLGMTVLVSQVKQMISQGQSIRAIACASTGDTSAALAAYAAKAGIPSIVFLPENKVSTAQLIQPVSNGAKVISLDTDFDGCMKIVQEVTQQENVYLANSMNSLRIEGQKTISFEIAQQFGWQIPDWIVIPGGNLGNVSALGNGFLMLKEMGLIEKLPRIALAQAENANPLYRSFLKDFAEFESVEASPTLASAIQIGNPVSIRKAIKTLQQFQGVVADASEEELADASARGDLYGMYNDPHTGVALAAMLKLIDKGTIQKGQKVIVISTANGLKFTEFKVKYHQKALAEVQSRHANEIISCKANLGAVMDIVRTLHPTS